MKIAIFGSYNGTSVGDTAILLGLLQAINRVAPDAKITILTMGPIDLSRDLALTGLAHAPRMVRANTLAAAEWPLLRSVWWRVNRLGLKLGGGVNRSRCRKLLDKADLLIVGGGNLLMDLFEGNIAFLETICAIARNSGTPYCFAGVGAGPVEFDASRHKLRDCIASAYHVFVRDESSRQTCVEVIGYSKVNVAPDFAFALDSAIQIPSERPVLAINVAAVFAETWPKQDRARYQAYLHGFVRLVRAAATRTKPKAIEIITTNPAVDACAAKDLAALLLESNWCGECAIIIRHCKDVSDAIDAFSRAQLAIVTRLHAGIMAALSGCVVLPVSYQQKVAAVLGETGAASYSIDLEQLMLPNFDPTSVVTDSLAHSGKLRPTIKTEVAEMVRSLLESAESSSAA